MAFLLIIIIDIADRVLYSRCMPSVTSISYYFKSVLNAPPLQKHGVANGRSGRTGAGV